MSDPTLKLVGAWSGRGPALDSHWLLARGH